MKRVVRITEKQANELGLPKKVRQNLVKYGDGETASPDYSISSSNGDLGYAHVTGGDAGVICESGGGNIETFYRGFHRELGNQKTHILWLSSNIAYAAAYGDTVAEYKIDTDLCNGDIDDLSGNTDHYTGPSWGEAQRLLKRGVNSYFFDADNYSETLVLWDKSPIVSKRIMAHEEVEKLLKSSQNENKLNESFSPIWKLYRGYKKKFGPWRDHLFWLTDDPSYAKEYGDTVAEVKVDSRRLHSVASSEVGDDDFDIYCGPSQEMASELLKQGVNCYSFYTSDMATEILCLWDKNAIVGFRNLSPVEYDSIPLLENRGGDKIGRAHV